MQSTTYFLAHSENPKLLFRYWEVRNAKACVCIVHGLGDHSGRYKHLAEALIAAQFSVCALDLRGHGQSSGIRGHAPSFNALFNDIENLLVEADKHFPDIPKILYGHSMGGSLALNYYFNRKPLINGIVIASPWFKLANPPMQITISLVRVLQYLLPFLKFNNGLHTADLTRDSEIIEQTLADPLAHRKISARLFCQAYCYGQKVANKGYKMNIPMLLMHGAADNITSHKASMVFSRNTGHFTSFISWPAAYHELHNDINRNAVFASVINWINEKILLNNGC